MLESINRLREIFVAKKMIFVIFGLMLIGVCIVIMVFNNKKIAKTTKPSNEQIILAYLRQIGANLQQESVINNQTSLKQYSTMKELESELQAVKSQLIIFCSNTSNQEIQQLIIKENKQISDQILVLANQLRTLKQRNQIKKFLSVSVLPFKVISIDIWNGEPQATVVTHGISDLMSKSDTRCGWKLVDLDFSSSEAVFMNSKNQFVRVNLSY